MAAASRRIMKISSLSRFNSIFVVFSLVICSIASADIFDANGVKMTWKLFLNKMLSKVFFLPKVKFHDERKTTSHV